MDELSVALERAVAGEMSLRQPISGNLGALPSHPPISRNSRERQATPDPDTQVDRVPLGVFENKHTEVDLEPSGALEGVPDSSSLEELDDPDEQRPTDFFEPDPPTGERRVPSSSHHEPAFLATARPGFDSIDEQALTIPPSSNRTAGIIALVVLFAGSATAGFILMRGGDDEDKAVDSAVIDAAAPLDAPSAASATVDAAAGKIGTSSKSLPDAGAGKSGGKKPRRPSGFGSVKVVTRPTDARVYVDGTYRGPDGVTISDVLGTKLRITCRLAEHTTGSVSWTLKTDDDIVICRPTKPSKCSDGIKNPFEDCP
jgi:hypothetical protein